MRIRKKLLATGLVLVIMGAAVLGSSVAWTPFQALGVNYYALLAWVLAPLLVASVLFAVGLSGIVMGFIIPEKFCIQCGKPIDIDSIFCKYCGHEYGEPKSTGGSP
jgi:hypothetical protein